ncbi:restriction endonuclease [Candidatus Woesearchaeota archaeon]|nr:restriction endonuclease [Candidatus Woesearchaeota archaeon]
MIFLRFYVMVTGYQFERYVAEYLARQGKRRVQMNQYLKEEDYRSEIDITYRSWFRTFYVECKYHAEPDKVSLSEVAKFAAVLYLHRIPGNRGRIVTNSSLDVRAQVYANLTGIVVTDGQALLDSARSWRTRGASLDEIIMKTV